MGTDGGIFCRIDTASAGNIPDTWLRDSRDSGVRLCDIFSLECIRFGEFANRIASRCAVTACGSGDLYSSLYVYPPEK